MADALGADGLRKVTQDLTWERTAALTEAAYRVWSGTIRDHLEGREKK